MHHMRDCVGIIVGVQHIDGPLDVKYWGVRTPLTPAALTPMLPCSKSCTAFNSVCLCVCLPFNVIIPEPLEIHQKSFRASSYGRKGGQVQKWPFRGAWVVI